MQAAPIASRSAPGGDGVTFPSRQDAAAVCSECGAVHADGRWEWRDRPQFAREVVCPACRCTAGQLAIGIVHISGGFEEAHRDHLTCIIRHYGAKAAAVHPQKRIVAIVTDVTGIRVMATDACLTRDIEAVLRRVYNGRLEFLHHEAPAPAFA